VAPSEVTCHCLCFVTGGQYWRHAAIMTETAALSIQDLNLAQANSPHSKQTMLEQLHEALFTLGLYTSRITGLLKRKSQALTSRLPLSLIHLTRPRLHSPSRTQRTLQVTRGFAEEVTLGQKDLREQFDFATQLPVVYNPVASTLMQVRGRAFAHHTSCSVDPMNGRVEKVFLDSARLS
jgi:hypothetical protein